MMDIENDTKIDDVIFDFDGAGLVFFSRWKEDEDGGLVLNQEIFLDGSNFGITIELDENITSESLRWLADRLDEAENKALNLQVKIAGENLKIANQDLERELAEARREKEIREFEKAFGMKSGDFSEMTKILQNFVDAVFEKEEK